MKISITLTEAELRGIKSYLSEVEEPTDKDSIESEIRTRLYHALRMPNEAMSDHVLAEENKAMKAYNEA